MSEGTTFGCQKWSGGTTFGCQNWSGVGPLLAAKSGLGWDHFWLPKVVWGDQFWLPKVVRGTIFGMTDPSKVLGTPRHDVDSTAVPDVHGIDMVFDTITVAADEHG